MTVAAAAFATAAAAAAIGFEVSGLHVFFSKIRSSVQHIKKAVYAFMKSHAGIELTTIPRNTETETENNNVKVPDQTPKNMDGKQI